MRRASLPSTIGYPLVLLVACGTSFSASSPDGGSSMDAGGDSATVGEAGGLEAGGNETGGAETGAKEGGGPEAGSGEASASDTGMAVEGGGPGTSCGPGLVCNGTGGQQGTVCCVDDTASPTYGCAGSACGCYTQLECSSDADCLGNQCCIDKVDGGCTGGHFVSSCRVACPAAHMCDPAQAASACLVSLSCSTDTSSVGLPAGVGFGICK